MIQVRYYGLEFSYFKVIDAGLMPGFLSWRVTIKVLVSIFNWTVIMSYTLEVPNRAIKRLSQCYGTAILLKKSR